MKCVKESRFKTLARIKCCIYLFIDDVIMKNYFVGKSGWNRSVLPSFMIYSYYLLQVV